MFPLRNVGSGIALLHAWRVMSREQLGEEPDLTRLRRQSRDLYIPAGQIGFWQAAVREPDDEMREHLEGAWDTGIPLIVDLLYGDHEGEQRAISPISLAKTLEGSWLPGVARHYRLDGVNPRD
ncbi:MAG TPA: hypothetical protein VID68_04310 [Solirubrobacteraceae bacterium]